MPARCSRYQGLPDAVDRDRAGRAVVRTGLRPLPDVSGTFEHTLRDGERLDHLGAAYYQEPRKWWRICDANPEVLSPRELVGRGPRHTVRLPLAGSGPSLARLAETLRADPGVERVRLAPDPLVAEVIYDRHVTSERALVQRVRGAGFAPGEPVAIGRAGKRITIPPDTP